MNPDDTQFSIGKSMDRLFSTVNTFLQALQKAFSLKLQGRRQPIVEEVKNIYNESIT